MFNHHIYFIYYKAVYQVGICTKQKNVQHLVYFIAVCGSKTPFKHNLWKENKRMVMQNQLESY